MGIDGPTFLPKKWLVFTSLREGLSQKVGVFFIFEPILPVGFLNKTLSGLFKQEMHLCPCFWCVGCCIFTVLFNCYSKGRFLNKKAPPP